MPTKPRLATAQASELVYQTWDEFVEEATKDITPYGLVLPGDDRPTIFPCPTGAQMQAFGVAMNTMNDEAGAAAIFGEHADRIIDLTQGQPFVVRARLMAEIMKHYGIQAGGTQPGDEQTGE